MESEMRSEKGISMRQAPLPLSRQPLTGKSRQVGGDGKSRSLVDERACQQNAQTSVPKPQIPKPKYQDFPSTRSA